MKVKQYNPKVGMVDPNEMAFEKPMPTVKVAQPEPPTPVKPHAHDSAIKASRELGIEVAKDSITVYIKLPPGKRAEVIFTGAWNGRLIRACQNALIHAYKAQKLTGALYQATKS